MGEVELVKRLDYWIVSEAYIFGMDRQSSWIGEDFAVLERFFGERNFGNSERTRGVQVRHYVYLSIQYT